ncbi:DUF2628 domain-containing protein [Lampropedia aestuarii]|uniref:DUF2628 domain-containing protein n=1 Tax=Lampropedia aestuarii TaxID=2562762 RepID=A0A4S5BMH7_9BURK|nr:DUF2628 domain-containing protein [Lampropedia aestuarii]THJ30908.1 DUF2628 domain-containing protein [Lampropedia aestuarii]
MTQPVSNTSPNPPSNTVDAAHAPNPVIGLSSEEKEERARQALMRAYVGQKYDKYQQLWAKSETRTSKQSWNWAAFFLSVLWLAYRKMYGYAALWVGLIVLEAIASYAIGYDESYSTIFSIVLTVIAGQLGNTMYLSHVNGKIKHIRSTQPHTHWISMLTKSGGTSWGAAIGVAVLIIALLFGVVIAFEGM